MDPIKTEDVNTEQIVTNKQDSSGRVVHKTINTVFFWKTRKLGKQDNREEINKKSIKQPIYSIYHIIMPLLAT